MFRHTTPKLHFYWDAKSSNAYFALHVLKYMSLRHNCDHTSTEDFLLLFYFVLFSLFFSFFKEKDKGEFMYK